MFVFLSRLVMLLIAISAIRSTLRFIQRFWYGLNETRAGVAKAAPQSPAGSATVLQQDPVCGTYVAIDASLKRIVNGRVIHFCSPACRDKYAA